MRKMRVKHLKIFYKSYVIHGFVGTFCRFFFFEKGALVWIPTLEWLLHSSLKHLILNLYSYLLCVYRYLWDLGKNIQKIANYVN